MSKKLPAISEFEAWWRDTVPIWLRWLLAIPVSAISAGLIFLLVGYFLQRGLEESCFGFFADMLAKSLMPPVAFTIFLWCVWTFFPRGKYEACIVFLVIRGLFLLAVVSLVVAKFVDAEFAQQMAPLDKERWAELVGEVLALAAGVWAVWAMKRDFDSLVDAERIQLEVNSDSQD